MLKKHIANTITSSLRGQTQLYHEDFYQLRFLDERRPEFGHI